MHSGFVHVGLICLGLYTLAEENHLAQASSLSGLGFKDVG